MILFVQFNSILIISLILFCQLISNISHAGSDDKKQEKKETIQLNNRDQLMKDRQTTDSEDIGNVIRQAESFKDFFILPGKNGNISGDIPKIFEYPLTFQTAQKRSSMLNTIYFLGLIKALYKDTPNYKKGDFDKIENFFVKLEKWKGITSEKELDECLEINRKNDLSEMSIFLDQKNISGTDYYRTSSYSEFESVKTFINNYIGNFREVYDSTSTLVSLLSFLSADDNKKEQMKPELSEKIYSNTHAIELCLQSAHICPKEEDLSSLASFFQIVNGFRTTYSGGKAWVGTSSNFKEYQNKKNSIMEYLESANVSQLKKELPTAIKALRYFHYHKNRKYKIDILTQKACLAIDANPNDYKPDATS